MLIKMYGLYWNPDLVDWGSKGQGNSGKLLGSVNLDDDTTAKTDVDYWDAQGIYVLYKDFKAVYVGMARNSLGKRIKAHLSDRLSKRWDMFSWFSVNSPNKGTGGVKKAGLRQTGPDIYIPTFEALAILIADPPLNRRQEKFKDALEADQKNMAESEL
jgi:hypothetical protein